MSTKIAPEEPDDRERELMAQRVSERDGIPIEQARLRVERMYAGEKK